MWPLRPCKFYNGIERHIHDCYGAIWYSCDFHSFLFKLVMLVRIRITILWEVVTPFSGKFYNLFDFGRENPIIWVSGHSLEELLSTVVLIIGVLAGTVSPDEIDLKMIPLSSMYGGWDLAECKCQCQCRNSPGLDTSILRHIEILGAADEAVLNNVHKKKNPKIPLYM
jgi:hypothetical protein